jgi:phosphoribosylformylglycinamidine synthase PurS subunit
VKALVHVTLKPDVLDPQGKAIQKASVSLGYAAIQSVRQGKLFEIELDARDVAAAQELLAELCKKLLANPVIEDFEIVSIKES